MRRLAVLWVWVVCGMAVAAGCKEASPPAKSEGKPRIAVIPKGTTHEFWTAVESGARQAEKDFGVEVIWKGPLKESEKNQQIAILEQFISEGVSGIALAPLDEFALAPAVLSAKQKKIPVVIYDSALRGHVGKDFVSFVATNNRRGGQMAGEELARLLGDNKKVILLRYQEGSASTMEREAGFLEVMAKTAGVTIIEKNRYAGATMGEAQTAAMNMIDKLREAGGIFCPNESSTAGMLLALQQNDLAGKVKFVGFDASKPLLDALRAGEIHALVSQDPRGMGYKAVETMVRHLRGQTVPAYIDTGCKLLTKNNLPVEKK